RRPPVSRLWCSSCRSPPCVLRPPLTSARPALPTFCPMTTHDTAHDRDPAPVTDSVPAPDHPFDEALRLRPLDVGRFVGRTAEAYRNMVGPYGGITAAMMLQALLLRPERLGDPVALTVNYAGPVPDGEFEIATREIRTSRTTQHWCAEMRHGSEATVSTTASAVFGLR